jgi:hypothetical protein
MIEQKDFKFRDDMSKGSEETTVPIEILTFPYQNVIFRYTTVGVKEQENGTAVLRFQYDILDTGEYTETKLRNDQRFEQHLGLLLNHLILESAEHEVNESRKNDLEESSDERGLLP